MRRIPDILIVTGVILGAVAFAAGLPLAGSISIALAMLVGWKRQWCLRTLLIGGGDGDSGAGQTDDAISLAVPGEDAGNSSSGDSGGGDGD